MALKCLCDFPIAVTESIAASIQLPTCRFWNVTSQQWSSSGVLTLGIVRDSMGKSFLSCASTHLTAFTGSRGGGIASRFSLNTVHPIDDAGTITVKNHTRVAGACA
jgi:hypothetical protein